VKGWLGRAEASTVLRGRRGSRIARWSRWFSRTGPVAERNFQGAGDPYPGHWREFPTPWPPAAPDDVIMRERLREALDALPPTWRAVVHEHDVGGRSDAEIAAELGLTEAQERDILTRAREALRDRLAEPDPRGAER
jgi:RNA polymerase sigma-70 factor (ECF subfamily)